MIRITSSTYTEEHLFTLHDEKYRKLFPEYQAQHFHHTVAQLLFLCMISRPDIQPLVTFLTTRVRYLDEDDWGQLKQGLKYLKCTLYTNMYLCADSINMISLWVDALYATHWEFDNNTVEVMLMEASEILSFSRKQNLNTVSSTEAERVGISDALGLMMWTQYFLEA